MSWLGLLSIISAMHSVHKHETFSSMREMDFFFKKSNSEFELLNKMSILESLDPGFEVEICYTGLSKNCF
jgi:hypothetical protein